MVSLLENPPAYMASAATVSECEFLVWDHSTIRRLAKAYPQIRENGLRLALHYLKMYIDWSKSSSLYGIGFRALPLASTPPRTEAP